MLKATELKNCVNAQKFLKQAMTTVTCSGIEDLLAQLPTVGEDEYCFDRSQTNQNWTENCFHWIPVGLDRGNAGRIKLASHPVNPIAERLINGMEALIELSRQKELLEDSTKEAPQNPRESVRRYFGIPHLDQIPKLDNNDRKTISKSARELARQLRVRLIRDNNSREFSVSIEDDGIGQSPDKIHETLLSLGSTTKGNKPYLIGVFGQGGSSSYSACEYSWVMSSRHPALLSGDNAGIGWTIIKHIYPKGRRDDYFAYLAAHPNGRVPFFSKEVGERMGINHGTRFVHIRYDFGKGGSQIVRRMYQSLNHVLFNPVIPYELYAARESADLMNGNSYRLSNLKVRGQGALLDKTFMSQPVGIG